MPGEQATPASNHSTNNLSTHSIDNLSAHSIASDTNQESSEQGIESPGDSHSQTSNLDSGGMLPEESTAEANSDFSEEGDTVSDTSGYGEGFGTALEHDPDVLGNLVSRQIGSGARPNPS
jgi:hypothetical protein